MRYLKPIFKTIKKPFKKLKVFIKMKLGWLGIPKIIAYNGYGNFNNVFIKGRVIEDKGLSKPKDSQKVWHNILATLKRFSSDELGGIKIKAELLGEAQVTTTDEMGFFSFHFNIRDIDAAREKSNWVSVYFELIDQWVQEQPKISETGQVRIIPDEIERIVVSDIDDTVLISHSTQTIRKLRLMLFKNALGRMPFPGVSDFYRALCRGENAKKEFPFFYVSSSEWNLYDLLTDFFEFNDMPKGVLLLRRLNHSIFKFWKSGGGNHEHKYEKIKELLELFPAQKFILIGDSGQRDPEIYSKLAVEFPGRIDTIYIRKIRKRSFLRREQNLPHELAEVGTTYLELKNTREAIKHAFDKGYIFKEAALEALNK